MKLTWAVIILLLGACSHIKKDNVPGRYVWNDGRTADTLEIRVDGTYEYWTFLPGQKIANSGAWKFDSTRNEIEFERENFPFLNDHIQEGSWVPEMRLKNNEIRLLYPSTGENYLKQIKRFDARR
jgi:hypothetical protein